MAYGQNDPATDRRISRLSLISSAANLYAGKTADPSIVLQAAQEWESWIYAVQSMPTPSNGSAPPPEAVPACEECGNPLTQVMFKNGNAWSIAHLASQGSTKFGRVLCKTHYFGKKTPA